MFISLIAASQYMVQVKYYIFKIIQMINIMVNSAGLKTGIRNHTMNQTTGDISTFSTTEILNTVLMMMMSVLMV